MTTVTVTKRGNVRIDGEKFYAVSETVNDTCNAGCVGHASGICYKLPCLPAERGHVGYRLRGTDVSFVTREEFLKWKDSIEKELFK